MKKNILITILLLVIISTLNAQEYVNVTFRHYSTNTNVVRAFVPGSFNNWGPNSSGFIAPGAPSQMSFIDSLGFWVKKIRLRVGDTHNYKFYEHWNESGSERDWFTDPLNPDINYSDHNNSIITIKKTMIFEVLPKDGNIITDQQSEITAGVFITENDSILLNQSTISLDGEFLSTFANNLISELSLLKYKLPELTNGNHTLVLNILTKNGESESDSINFTYQGAAPEIAALPDGVIDGINYVSDSTVTLVLLAPYYKNFVYVIGDFNDWQVDQNYFMKQVPDRQKYWLTISGLDPNEEYRFQYFVDGEIRIADPYAEKVLDPWNDKYISEDTYPDLIPYPTGKTSEIVSVLQINQEEYQWQVSDFNRSLKEDLVIYELLVRDFIAEHDYKTLVDTLDYFKRLGINAIELTPINEFEGNESWGYNPSFYFAPDKYYGTKNNLKRFVDECHKRGIAVIIDVVLNHAYGQCSLVRLFANNPGQSPWFNEQAPHTDYSWGYDFNHEKSATKNFVDRFFTYWLTEFHIDGFRLDFTRGFTNKYGYSGARDESRIQILKRIYDHVQSIDSTAYMILEHLIDDNSEMKELVEYGMMLWGNMNTAYSQSAMGWLEDYQQSSNLSWGYFKTRGWQKPGLVTYMESHDEPWLMYKNLQYGRSHAAYNIQHLKTALNRIKLCAAFFLTLPGPKMMWQFGELGYDQYLPDSGYERTAPKPILWNYYNQPERKSLFEYYAALIKLRKEHEVFRDPDANVQMRVGQGQYDRRINISNDTMNVTIVGNFHVVPLDVIPNFQQTGNWYDYFTGDTIVVSDSQTPIFLLPGEFHIYSDKKLDKPLFTTKVKNEEQNIITGFMLERNFPNPFNPITTIQYQLSVATEVRLEIYNLQGQKVKTIVHAKQAAATYRTVWDGFTDEGQRTSSGLYLYSLHAGDYVQTRKMLFLK